MSTDQLAGVHLERIRHHAPVDEYDQYLQRWIDDPVYRRMLRHYRDQFVVRYPDIEAWFASPLFERVGHEWWNAGPPRSRRSLCHSARSYLHYLGLRGYVWFDWDWVLAIARHRIWELDERLGLTIHRDAEALFTDPDRATFASPGTTTGISTMCTLYVLCSITAVNSPRNPAVLDAALGSGRYDAHAWRRSPPASLLPADLPIAPALLPPSNMRCARSSPG
jgi:hypothetical protein